MYKYEIRTEVDIFWSEKKMQKWRKNYKNESWWRRLRRDEIEDENGRE
jgi:hypothetical protein